ncbi:flotillin-1 [Eurytemora carolleeae]|uniref:flotillin-1 n=1 Tax=Eurytemora carolleeae TaxID=1294199 RepID=UPI000C76A8B9|nr:flotillin-1 [Eurytemora carolleeae]|eukprot:XP_023331804.1 flotillin-1-like [Eurytemora affinis]
MGGCCCKMGFITGGPNEAIVVSGCFHSRPKLVVGGWAFVCPCVQKIQRLSLNLMTLQVYTPRVYTVHGVPLSVTGIAQVKIAANNDDMLRAAVEQFIGKTDKEIKEIARITLEGHQRAIMGALTVDEIFKDRKKFSEQVFDVASTDLVNMGIQVISFTLRDIKDEESYMESMGQARTSEVLRDARIGEAECTRDSLIDTALSEESRMAARLFNDTQIERYKRDFLLKKAEYDKEVETARAEAELAYRLQAAKIQQRIAEETKNIDIVERLKQIEIQEQEILRYNHHSHICIVMAIANRTKLIEEANAEAEAIALKGDAEAFAISVKGKAEAEQMAKKADAYGEYKKAAKIAMWMEALPGLAAEVAAPISQTNSIKMIMDCEGKPGETAGPAALTKEILEIMCSIPEKVTEVSGLPSYLLQDLKVQ